MQLDLILRNADVVTMDRARPSASDVGILNGQIVGLDDDLSGLSAREERDLRGATVTPGFIDAHCHTTWFGLGLAETDLAGARGLDDVYRRLEAAAPDGGEDEWLVATGFNQGDHGGAFPRLDVLDKITGGRPLYIRHVSGHMAIANSASLRRAGVLDPGFRDPEGGVVVRDAQGHPTGLLQETAQRLIQDLILPYSLDTIAAALERATRRYAAEGITSFTEAGIGGGWIGHSPIEAAAYQRARRGGTLHARAQLMPAIDALHQLSGHADDNVGIGLDLGIRSGFGDDLLSFGPVKVFLDGSLLSETAAMTEAYCHGHRHGGTGGEERPAGEQDSPGNNGYFQSDPQAVRQRILAAYRSGWAVAAHAIGDRGIDLAIDVITECVDSYGPAPLPNRIEHASVTRPEQLARIASAGIAVTPQASFFEPMGDDIMASLGAKRSAWAYRARSFLEAGILVAGSSDRPVADGAVLRGIQAYVDRRTVAGAVFGSESEKLTAAEALAAYTVGAARATGSLHRKGSISTGKLADLAVLSASPLSVPTNEILGIEVKATLMGGSFTHNTLD